MISPFLVENLKRKYWVVSVSFGIREEDYISIIVYNDDDDEGEGEEEEVVLLFWPEGKRDRIE